MTTATHRIGRGVLRSPARREALQLLLAREQLLLRTRVGALRERGRGEVLETTDIEERAEESVDFGVDAAAAVLTARTVRGIEVALQRLATGLYGVCLDCSSRIEPSRLRATPFAQLCRGCQEQYDGSSGGLPVRV